jgi:hypothetical protein
MFPHRTPMSRIILVGALLAMAGTEGWSSASREDTLRFYRPDVKGIPECVASWLKTFHGKESFDE